MRQILFEIPLHSLWDRLPNIPIHGYGFMLFLAFVFCTWLATRLARRQGIAPVHVQDLAIWIFLFGIAGARITFMIQYGVPIWKFYEVWEGGLVFYGSAIGGLIGFGLAYLFLLRKHKISLAKMADVIAPCAALGLAIGRIGCLLNGCCYGGVACPDCPAVVFPLPTEPRRMLVENGYQTAAGFTMDTDAKDDSRTVGQVVPGSAAEQAGLRAGDIIVAINAQKVKDYEDIWNVLVPRWPRGKNDIELTVQRDGETVALPAFIPWTIGLHPTQIYETISASLLVFLLLSYWPFRRHDGELLALLMIGYAIHRYLNEILRNDTNPVAFGLTLSQNISILFLIAGLVMGLWLWLQPPQYGPGAVPPVEEPAAAAETVRTSEPEIALHD